MNVPVDIVTSKRRKKTVSARMVDGRVVVTVPESSTLAEREAWARDLKAKILARQDKSRSRTSDEVLAKRAAELNQTYLGGRAVPTSIRWVTNQTTRWGSCTMPDASIRISSTLQGVPDWVLDSVLVHELSHLLIQGHGPDFQALVDRYPRTRDAGIFLDGYAHGIRKL